MSVEIKERPCVATTIKDGFRVLMKNHSRKIIYISFKRSLFEESKMSKIEWFVSIIY